MLISFSPSTPYLRTSLNLTNQACGGLDLTILCAVEQMQVPQLRQKCTSGDERLGDGGLPLLALAQKVKIQLLSSFLMLLAYCKGL
ncbi:hypothetical protein SLA2020_029610 [Shorea laevis]